MKTIPFSLFITCLFLLLSFSTLKAQTGNAAAAQSASLSVLDGGWRSVAFIINGVKDTSRADYRVYHRGFFSIVGKDSSGRWSETHAGTYEISGNLYKEHIQFCSYPERIGMIHWQEFTIKGDTATFKLFNKVLTPQGTEIGGTMPKIEIVCVRMKQ